jgi:hypothetical protein
LITCDNVKELQFGKFLWLDERVHASEASFRGRPVVAIRALMEGTWLATHRKPQHKIELLDWMKNQRYMPLFYVVASDVGDVCAPVWSMCNVAVVSIVLAVDVVSLCFISNVSSVAIRLDLCGCLLHEESWCLSTVVGCCQTRKRFFFCFRF